MKRPTVRPCHAKCAQCLPAGLAERRRGRRWPCRAVPAAGDAWVPRAGGQACSPPVPPHTRQELRAVCHWGGRQHRRPLPAIRGILPGPCLATSGRGRRSPLGLPGGARPRLDVLLPRQQPVNHRAPLSHRSLLKTFLCLKVHAAFWASHPGAPQILFSPQDQGKRRTSW